MHSRTNIAKTEMPKEVSEKEIKIPSCEEKCYLDI
jgi:hypothetical protein